jgi:tRNA modification GTPase
VASAADTIAAVATPAGRGAVGVIRVSGALAPQVGLGLLGTLPAPRVAQLMRFLDADGTTLDQGLVLYFSAPASFTGEHVLELQGHGGVLVLELVLNRLFALGCRPARPGEFSERAFLNGKIDVTQAEAVADLIDAGTAAAARAAVRSMQGDFSARIHALQAQLTELRTRVEATIDFPDEEVDALPTAVLRERLSQVFAAFVAIEAAARQGALLRDGFHVVIAGRPNAGKSSLLNRLVGDDVAIVTALPGTTRDLLRQHVQLDGMPLYLVDTAGLRTAADVVEEEGIRRARAEMQRADRILFVIDGSLSDAPDAAALAAELALLPRGIPLTLLVNKIDLTGASPRLEERAGMTHIYLSAASGAGLELLREHLKHSAGFRDSPSGALSARRRHLLALQRAHELVLAAAEALEQLRAAELLAEDLRLAQQALGEITGEFSSDDLLGEIFSSFCIGK